MSRIVAPWTIDREKIVKAEADTDPDHGCKPEERSYPDLVKLGIVNLDKPPGPTSHEVASWLKKILGVRQAGHGGTLVV